MTATFSDFWSYPKSAPALGLTHAVQHSEAWHENAAQSKKGRPDNGAASIKRGRALLAVNEVGGSEQVYIIDAHQNNGEVVTTRAPNTAVAFRVNQQIAVGRAGNEHNVVERRAEQTLSISSCGRSLNGDRCRAGYFGVRKIKSAHSKCDFIALCFGEVHDVIGCGLGLTTRGSLAKSNVSAPRLPNRTILVSRTFGGITSLPCPP